MHIDTYFSIVNIFGHFPLSFLQNFIYPPLSPRNSPNQKTTPKSKKYFILPPPPIIFHHQKTANPQNVTPGTKVKVTSPICYCCMPRMYRMPLKQWRFGSLVWRQEIQEKPTSRGAAVPALISRLVWWTQISNNATFFFVTRGGKGMERLFFGESFVFLVRF